MRTTSWWWCIAAVWALCFAQRLRLVRGHGYLVYPTAQSGTNPTFHTATCALDTTGDVSPYKGIVGQPYVVTWDIIANHGGTVGINQIVNGKTYNLISGVTDTNDVATVEFPYDCDHCLLQWDWTTLSENNDYWGCADIEVLAAPENMTMTILVSSGTTEDDVISMAKAGLAEIADVDQTLVLVDSVEVSGTRATVVFSFNYTTAYVSNDDKLDTVQERYDSGSTSGSGLTITSMSKGIPPSSSSSSSKDSGGGGGGFSKFFPGNAENNNGSGSHNGAQKGVVGAAVLIGLVVIRSLDIVY